MIQEVQYGMSASITLLMRGRFPGHRQCQLLQELKCGGLTPPSPARLEGEDEEKEGRLGLLSTGCAPPRGRGLRCTRGYIPAPLRGCQGRE